MKENGLNNKIFNAAKWSTITEIAAKLILPITNMILARIISPEAFGVVATITMITSFADMFTDAGFQKYLIQHQFKDKVEKYKYANVAFLTNIIVSLFLWVIISLYSDQIALLVGSPGLGNVISVACIQLPITAFSSIQIALYRRDFNFKTLFWVRIISLLIPLLVTIPLAILGLSYWSLVIGNIFIQIASAFILTLKSEWKPHSYFNIIILKKMFSFSIWSLIEAISIWLTTWVDAFIIGSFLSEHLLGIYKTSTTMVNALMALVTASIIPVLFAGLSRLQDDKEQFDRLYFKIQKLVAIFILPLGVGIYLYSELATHVLLGSEWKEASKVIGIWGLTSSLMIVFGSFSSEVYRAKGKPKLSFLAQLLHLVVLVPTCLISVRYGFWTLVYGRSFSRFQFILVHLMIMQVVMKISVFKTFKNILIPLVLTLCMGGTGYLIKKAYSGIGWEIFSMVACILLYFAILFSVPSIRAELKNIGRKLASRLA